MQEERREALSLSLSLSLSLHASRLLLARVERLR